MKMHEKVSFNRYGTTLYFLFFSLLFKAALFSRSILNAAKIRMNTNSFRQK